MKIFFEPAPEDRESSEAYLQELETFQASASAGGVSLTPFGSNPIVASPTLEALGQFVVDHADVAKTILLPLFGAWLHAHYGRKVRLRVGDIEAEAQTREEVERLFDKGQEIQQRNAPKVIHEK